MKEIWEGNQTDVSVCIGGEEATKENKSTWAMEMWKKRTASVCVKVKKKKQKKEGNKKETNQYKCLIVKGISKEEDCWCMCVKVKKKQQKEGE